MYWSNDIWGGDALTEWGAPFWELATAKGLEMLERAVHSHIITSRHGAPLMVERNAGLIVEVTDGDTLGYRGNLFYDLAKNAVIRLAYAMAADLHAHRVTALAITPGFLRSEAVLDGLRRHGGELAGRHRGGPLLRRVRDALLRRPSRGGARLRPARRKQERWPVLELGAGEGVRLHRPGRPPARLGQLLPPARCRKPSTGAHRRTRWTGSWFAPASTRPNSTRQPPRRPPACAPGSDRQT